MSKGGPAQSVLIAAGYLKSPSEMQKGAQIGRFSGLV